ncbi:MAG: hypothetical protein ACRC5C_13135 [Bacilli bacterium]
MINLLTKFDMSSALEDFVFENAATIKNLDQDMVEFALSKGGARAITLLNKLIANKLAETMVVASLAEENATLKARLQAMESTPVQQTSATSETPVKAEKTYRQKEKGTAYKGIQQEIIPGTPVAIKDGELVLFEDTKLLHPGSREVLMDLKESHAQDNKAFLNDMLLQGCLFTVSNVRVNKTKDGKREFLKVDLSPQKKMEKPVKKQQGKTEDASEIKKPVKKKLQIGSTQTEKTEPQQNQEAEPQPVAVAAGSDLDDL